MYMYMSLFSLWARARHVSQGGCPHQWVRLCRGRRTAKVLAQLTVNIQHLTVDSTTAQLVMSTVSSTLSSTDFS